MSSEPLSVDLTPKAATLVRKAMEADGYASPGEVVEAALQDWSASRDHLGYSSAEIACLADEAIAGGPGQFGDIEEIKREVARRHTHGTE